MEKCFGQVVEFEKACGHELSSRKPETPDLKTVQLRYELIREEGAETLLALNAIQEAIGSCEPVTNEMIAEVADGLADLIWVCLGSAIHFGIDLPAVFREVDRSNMAKFSEGIIRRADGKIQKPKSWTPPDVLGVLNSQASLTETYGGHEG